MIYIFFDVGKLQTLISTYPLSCKVRGTYYRKVFGMKTLSEFSLLDTSKAIKGSKELFVIIKKIPIICILVMFIF